MTERENPLGVSRFGFIEFAALDPKPLQKLFENMGFRRVAQRKDGAIELYRQGDINFVLNATQNSFASEFAEAHGPCCCGFSLVVREAQSALQHVLQRGAEDRGDTPAGLDLPRIKGIGGSMLYLQSEDFDFDSQFEFVADRHHEGYGLTFVDHLTHNVHEGNMDQWANFYTRLFGFFEVKYFDIKGKQTGLRSRAMTAPNGEISIPINESSDPKSQINEYLDEYKGEGVQHIALYTDGIYGTVEKMREKELRFLDTPDTYYEVIDARIPGHGEDLPRMRTNKILIDADEETKRKLLLQIFTQNVIGPIFFEIIQRKGNEGFGEGNFQALFEAIERDQEKRGVL